MAFLCSRFDTAKTPFGRHVRLEREGVSGKDYGPGRFVSGRAIRVKGESGIGGDSGRENVAIFVARGRVILYNNGV